MSKTISARISDEAHEKLLEKCNNLGCSVNEYLNQHIESVVHDSVDKINNESNVKTKSNDVVRVVRRSDGTWKTPDGVVVEEIPEQKPVVIQLFDD